MMQAIFLWKCFCQEFYIRYSVLVVLYFSDEHRPMVWMNRSVNIAINDQFWTDNPRATLEKIPSGNERRYRLTIAEAELMDGGEYECQIPGRVSLTQRHNVIVNSKYDNRLLLSMWSGDLTNISLYCL